MKKILIWNKFIYFIDKIILFKIDIGKFIIEGFEEFVLLC